MSPAQQAQNGYGLPERRRVDSGGYPPVNGGAAQGERVRPDGLTPAQAYQEAEGYGRHTYSPHPGGPSPPPSAGGHQRRPESSGSMQYADQRVVSGSSTQTARGVPPSSTGAGYTSPPPGYSSAGSDAQRQERDRATPPQLPDLVTESQTFDFLQDLERLGLGGDADERDRVATAPNRDEAISPKSQMPNSTSSGSLGSTQRHYEDELRGERRRLVLYGRV